MSEDLIIKKLLEHDERFTKLVSSEEFQDLKNKILNGQDTMIGILQRLDEERIFTIKWIKEIETKVEHNTLELQKIKLRFNV